MKKRLMLLKKQWISAVIIESLILKVTAAKLSGVILPPAARFTDVITSVSSLYSKSPGSTTGVSAALKRTIPRPSYEIIWLSDTFSVVGPSQAGNPKSEVSKNIDRGRFL